MQRAKCLTYGPARITRPYAPQQPFVYAAAVARFARA
jgi:hypothetical protein